MSDETPRTPRIISDDELLAERERRKKERKR
jgi:hypothetical protein